VGSKLGEALEQFAKDDDQKLERHRQALPE
jgi:hypothetical protein